MVSEGAATGWRGRVGGKLMSPAEAMAIVRPGDTVWMGVAGSVPTTLCGALAARAEELPGVTVATALTPFDWDRPELLRHFRIRGFCAGPRDWAAVQSGRFAYVPAAGFRKGKLPSGFDLAYDVAAIPISPPDADGYCSFGAAVCFGPTVAATARQLVGEVHPEFIRTGGQNRIHISRFTRLAEAAEPPLPAPSAPHSEETVAAAEVICALVAAELIPDRATLQIGVGGVSAGMALYLTDKRDLGIHTEQLPGGIVDLVDRGVVTGKYKEVHPGKVVASFATQLPPEELARLDGHPAFELHDCTHVDDLRVILQFERFVAVNSALFVDLTGNVCAESWGPPPFAGPDDRPTFAYAASVSSARSIVVLPSSQLVAGVRRARIMATLPAASTITTHRAYVDYVVTEQGIATLSGKSPRERIAELISVAHPDLRADLRQAAARVYRVTA